MPEIHYTDASKNPPLTDEQWEAAYNDLMQKYLALKLENESLTLALNKANEWRRDFDAGC